MNGMQILEGIIEIILSLVTGFLVFVLSLKIFTLLTRSLDEQKELKKKNTAVGAVLLAFILALVLIVNGSVTPAMETLTTLFTTEGVGALAVLLAVVRIIVIYVVSGAVAVLLLWLAIAIYTGLTTRIDEMAELRKSNLAVGILLGTFIFSAGFICMEPLATLLKAFVPQPLPGNAGVADNFVSNPDALIQGLIELPLAFIGTIFAYFLGVLLSDLMTGTINETAELKKNNAASAVYTASSLFGLMYLVNEAALKPLYKAMGFLFTYSASAGKVVVNGRPGDVVLTVVLIPVFFVVAGAIALLLTRSAQAVFMFLTKNIDEMAEVKKNNAAVALILAAVTIAVVILVTHGVSVVAQAVVPSARAPEAGGFIVPKLK
jgi:uncharacterized membrane protein YjfL (UPF0719 family)